VALEPLRETVGELHQAATGYVEHDRRAERIARRRGERTPVTIDGHAVERGPSWKYGRTAKFRAGRKSRGEGDARVVHRRAIARADLNGLNVPILAKRQLHPNREGLHFALRRQLVLAERQLEHLVGRPIHPPPRVLKFWRCRRATLALRRAAVYPPH